MVILEQGVFPARITDPHATALSQPFWDAALEGRLVVPRCTRCQTFVLPPEPFCFHCQNNTFEHVELPGTGTVYTFTVVRHPLAPQLSAVVPYVSGVVELDGTQGAGARMILNIVGGDPDTVRIGDRGRVRFDKVSDTYAIPRFELLANG